MFLQKDSEGLEKLFFEWVIPLKKSYSDDFCHHSSITLNCCREGIGRKCGRFNYTREKDEHMSLKFKAPKHNGWISGSFPLLPPPALLEKLLFPSPLAVMLSWAVWFKFLLNKVSSIVRAEVGGGDEFSYKDSNQRGRSGKINPAGDRIRGATGAINRQTGNKNRSPVCGLASERFITRT